MLNPIFYTRFKTTLAAGLFAVISIGASALELPDTHSSREALESPSTLSIPYPLDSLPPMIADALARLNPPPQRPSIPSYITEFEQYIAQQLVPSVPGAALLIVANGKVQIMNGYGVRSINSTEAVTPETVFRLASVSKTFASAAAGVLVGQRQLLWESPILSTLSQLSFKNPDYGQKITVRDILAHTSGLIPQAYTNLIENHVPYEDVVKRLSEVDFVCPPTQCYGYQNVVFSLIGDVIHATTGQTYEDFVSTNLFTPLGMTNATFGLTAFEASPNHALPHIWRRGQWITTKVDPNYYSLAPAAGVNASIQDMAQWLLAQLGQRPDVLSLTTLDDLQAKVVKTSVARSHYGLRSNMISTYYGLGWRVFDFGAHKNFVHHGGWVQGYRTEMVFNRELQIGMVFLTNAETKLARDVTFKFVNLYEDYQHQNLPGYLLRADANTP